MSITNIQIANLFEEIALFLRAENVAFKPQAYEVAAEHIRALEEELSDSYKKCGKECIDAITGIGKNLTLKIEKLVTTGQLKEYKQFKKKYSFDIVGMTSIPDVGPKTALTLFQKLRVKTIVDLERAAKAGKIASLPRMGTSTHPRTIQQSRYRHRSSSSWLG